jgi:hypothetical protein
VLEAIFWVAGWIVAGVARVLAWLGYEKLLEREDAKAKGDPRNFKPPH